MNIQECINIALQVINLEVREFNPIQIEAINSILSFEGYYESPVLTSTEKDQLDKIWAEVANTMFNWHGYVYNKGEKKLEYKSRNIPSQGMKNHI